VHRSSEGWQPLCGFLGVAVPKEPYPRVNSTEDMTGFGGSDQAPEGPEAGAQGYIDAMKAKAFGD
jgi:hypothetical protein